MEEDKWYFAQPHLRNSNIHWGLHSKTTHTRTCHLNLYLWYRYQKLNASHHKDTYSLGWVLFYRTLNQQLLLHSSLRAQHGPMHHHGYSDTFLWKSYEDQHVVYISTICEGRFLITKQDKTCKWIAMNFCRLRIQLQTKWNRFRDWKIWLETMISWKK